MYEIRIINDFTHSSLYGTFTHSRLESGCDLYFRQCPVILWFEGYLQIFTNKGRLQIEKVGCDELVEVTV